MTLASSENGGPAVSVPAEAVMTQAEEERQIANTVKKLGIEALPQGEENLVVQGTHTAVLPYERPVAAGDEGVWYGRGDETHVAKLAMWPDGKGGVDPKVGVHLELIEHQADGSKGQGDSMAFWVHTNEGTVDFSGTVEDWQIETSVAIARKVLGGVENSGIKATPIFSTPKPTNPR